MDGESNDWKSKHEFKYEDLYQLFALYQQRNGVTTPVPFNAFRDCVSKRLNIKVSRIDRKGGKYVRYYSFGENSDNVINLLKEKSLYIDK